MKYELPVLTVAEIENIGTEKKITQPGNDKTGPDILMHNRAVGFTCPPDCPFLDDGCYGQKGNCNYKNVKESKINATYASKSQIFEARMKAEVTLAKIKGRKAMRLHETGDFIDPYTGEIDYEYIEIMIRVASETQFPIWVYTHVDLGKELMGRMEAAGIKVFRSLHENIPDGPHGYNRAGEFERVAMVLETHIKSWDKSRKSTEVGGKSYLVCPHQIGEVKDCGTCGMCFKGIKRVAFLKH